MTLALPTIMNNGNGTTTLQYTCQECKKNNRVVVPTKKWEEWYALDDKPLVQKFWPELSENEREALMTGMHGPCYDNLFYDDSYPKLDPEIFPYGGYTA
jgi:hypothetical protein